MSEEEKILRDFVDNENCEYVYDWQGFDWKTICGAVDKILKENEEIKQRFYKVIHEIQLIQMDGEVSVRDITKLVSTLKGGK